MAVVLMAVALMAEATVMVTAAVRGQVAMIAVAMGVTAGGGGVALRRVRLPVTGGNGF